MRPIQPALLATLIISGVLVAGGAVLIVATRQPVSIGWFAYQPLASSVFSPDGVIVLTRFGVFGIIVTAVGLMGVSAAIGFMLGRRGRAVAEA
jgi:heme/copper-type cytochrome/quinol oxidase subunit 1